MFFVPLNIKSYLTCKGLILLRRTQVRTRKLIWHQSVDSHRLDIQKDSDVKNTFYMMAPKS